MSNKYLSLLLILFLSFCARKNYIDQKSEVAAESVKSSATKPLWQKLSLNQYKEVIQSDSRLPKEFRVFSLDSLEMRRRLISALNKQSEIYSKHSLIVPLDLPRPDSGFSTFNIYETTTMDSALAAHYPNLKTYGGQGIYESVRFDFNENGFNAHVVSQNGEWFIQPIKQGITHQYLMSFYKRDLIDSSKTPFELSDSLRK